MIIRVARAGSRSLLVSSGWSVRRLTTSPVASIARRQRRGGPGDEEKEDRFAGFGKDVFQPGEGDGKTGRGETPKWKAQPRNGDESNARRYPPSRSPRDQPSTRPQDPRRRNDDRRTSADKERSLRGERRKEGPERTQARPDVPKTKPAKARTIKATRVSIPLPRYISVSNLAKALDIKMRKLQYIMSQAGHTNIAPDLILSFEDAELLAMECNVIATPLTGNSTDYDIFPRPPPADLQSLPLRPPVVAIMGHVDHGKTTLLDKLRSASVAAGEAGGITQHVGAFSVEVQGMPSQSEGKKAITFLDTPGHAAFTQMRSRGAKVTDIVVLVVAADDGVMPQTKEVIQMVHEVQEEEGGARSGQKSSSLQLLVAISKMDLRDADPAKIKGQLMGENVILEELGGDVPCIEISGRTGDGLDALQENLVAMSELNEIRAERDGPMEGYVIESRLQKGFGNTAIVLVKRGTARVGDFCVAGTSWCKVRRLTDSSGAVNVDSAMPGEAVLMTGWRDLPNAGDMVLGVEASAEGVAAEELAKRCVETRRRVEEDRRLLRDVEAINEGRREDAEARAKVNKIGSEVRRLQREARLKGQQQLFDRQAVEMSVRAAHEAQDALNSDGKEVQPESQRKHELQLIVKADVSGTVEAVVGAISDIGNGEVGVKIVSAGVGDPSEGDFDLAQAVQGHILGFNVKADKAMQNAAERAVPPMMIHCDDVIYRLMSFVTEQCAALLPPLLETRIVGEASVQQVFAINVRGKQMLNVAGCRVTNGAIARNHMVRVLRASKAKSGGGGDRREKTAEEVVPKDAQYDNAGRLIVYDGKLDSLKQVKKEVDEMRKGAECGISFADNFQDFRQGDLIQSYYIEKVPRTL